MILGDAAIVNFVQDHHAGIQDLADPAIAPSPTAKAWKEGDRLFIPRESWHLMFPGDEATTAASRLRDTGILVGGDGKNLMKKAPRRLSTRLRVYTLSLSRLGISTTADTSPASNISTEPVQKGA